MRRLMGNRVMRRGVPALLLALGLTLPGWTAAHAEGIVVVPGTAFPGSDTYLAHFGCESLFHVDASRSEVATVLDDGAPLGRRALALRNADPGAATGPVSKVDSVADSRQALSVRAPDGSSGVAWVWYATGELDAGEVWVGRADLTASPGGWRDVGTGGASYAWTRVDSATGAVLEDAGAATAGEFTDLHGDGPGYLLAGLGCDGARQVLDDVRVRVPGAVTTYDLEGVDVTTSISVTSTQVAPGGRITVTGTTLDARGVVGAALVLQARSAGEADFRDVGSPVTPGPDGIVTTRVSPRDDTVYRWWFAERPWADAHVSPEVTIAVVTPSPTTGPSSPPSPAAPPAAPLEPAAPSTSGSPSATTPSSTAPAPAGPTATATPSEQPGGELSTVEPSPTP